MKFIEVLEAVAHGERAKRKNYDAATFLFYDDCCEKFFIHSGNMCREFFSVPVEDYIESLAEDWEICREEVTPACFSTAELLRELIDRKTLICIHGDSPDEDSIIFGKFDGKLALK